MGPGEWIPITEARFAHASAPLLATHCLAASESAELYAEWVERTPGLTPAARHIRRMAGADLPSWESALLGRLSRAEQQLREADRALWDSLKHQLLRGELEADGVADPIHGQREILRAESWRWLIIHSDGTVAEGKHSGSQGRRWHSPRVRLAICSPVGWLTGRAPSVREGGWLHFLAALHALIDPAVRDQLRGANGAWDDDRAMQGLTDELYRRCRLGEVIVEGRRLPPQPNEAHKRFEPDLLTEWHFDWDAETLKPHGLSVAQDTYGFLRFRLAEGEAMGQQPAPLPVATTVKRKRPSDKEVREWYRQRVASWPEGKPPPTEKADLEAVQRQFGSTLTRDEFRIVRKGEAPEHWRKPGPRGRRNHAAIIPPICGPQDSSA